MPQFGDYRADGRVKRAEWKAYGACKSLKESLLLERLDVIFPEMFMYKRSRRLHLPVIIFPLRQIPSPEVITNSIVRIIINAAR